MAQTSVEQQQTPRPPGERQARSSRRAERIRAERRRRWRNTRRVIALVLVIAAIPVAVSFIRFMTLPGQDSLPIRTVQWMRENGMAGVVNSIENFWYTRNPPPVGGTPEGGLPEVAAPSGSAASGRRIDAQTLAAATVPPRLTPPTNMQPLVTDPLADEGVWQPTGRTVAGLPAVYTAFFRPDAVHTSLVAAAMWLDTTLLKTVYVPGSRQPPGAPQTWGTKVPPEEWPALVAAFNAGFQMQDAQGGVYLEGQEVLPLVEGGASFVIYQDGKVDIGAWGRDVQMSPDVVTVRQNLALIVENGQPVAGLPDNADGAWGATVGNRVFVWRSGAGIEKNGGLVYVAGPGLSAVTLAILLQRAGAVRAMELDINHDWVTAYTYEQADPADPSSINGVKLLPAMAQANNRYLNPTEVDFFAFFSPH
jgi:Phosphodiester glycosidase